MSVCDALKERRSIYALNKELPVSVDEIKKLVTETTELVPDAFNMRSQRIVLVLGEKQNQLWDTVYDVFQGKVPRESYKLLAQMPFGGIEKLPDPKDTEDISKRVLIEE